MIQHHALPGYNYVKPLLVVPNNLSAFLRLDLCLLQLLCVYRAESLDSELLPPLTLSGRGLFGLSNALRHRLKHPNVPTCLIEQLASRPIIIVVFNIGVIVIEDSVSGYRNDHAFLERLRMVYSGKVV